MNGENSYPRNGFPLPGRQDVSVTDLMKSVFFMSDKRWEQCRGNGDFDYVVVGSSFCAWAFTQRVLQRNPKAKILILERGEYLYLEHFENLLPSSKRHLTSISKTFHWKITEKMRNGHYIKWQHGMNNAFGGQSAFWRGWCPKPTREELNGWPESVKDAIEEYFPKAAKLLNVVPANEISASERKGFEVNNHHCVFGELQNVLVEKLESSLPEAVKRVDQASLALRPDMLRYVNNSVFKRRRALRHSSVSQTNIARPFFFCFFFFFFKYK